VQLAWRKVQKTHGTVVQSANHSGLGHQDEQVTTMDKPIKAPVIKSAACGDRVSLRLLIKCFPSRPEKTRLGNCPREVLARELTASHTTRAAAFEPPPRARISATVEVARAPLVLRWAASPVGYAGRFAAAFARACSAGVSCFSRSSLALATSRLATTITGGKR
jgi:hypothetical protein